MGTIELRWAGPFGWPGYEGISKLPPVPAASGVYLLTFESQAQYLIYAAGFTVRGVPTRLREHTRAYLDGRYNVLDVPAAQAGERQEIWHGWHYRRSHPEEFEERNAAILESVHAQLAAFRVFVAHLGTDQRLLARVEAAVMAELKRPEQPSLVRQMPDDGMRLAPRTLGEEPIVLHSTNAALFHGLPACLNV